MHNDKNKIFPTDNIYEQNCPILYTLDILRKKWHLPIMWYLDQNKVARYNELKRKITGITNMMLTKTLQSLEKHKLIHRIQYNTIPLKVEYTLTKRGKALLNTLQELYIWGEEQIESDKK